MANKEISHPARRWLSKVLLSDYFVLYVSLAYLLVLSPFLPVLLKPANLSNQLLNIWPLLVVAIGQTFVLAIAGIDLSQGAVMALSSVICAMLIAVSGNASILADAPVWGVFIDEQGGLLSGSGSGMLLAIALMLMCAMFIGLINGVSVAVFGMPAFMVTLVMMIVISAFAIYLSHSENISNLPEAFVRIGKGDIVSVYLGAQDESKIPRKVIYSFITYPMVVAVSVAVAAHYLLNRTVFGRQVFAVGSNKRNAEVSGIPVRRVIVLVFVIAAVCASIGSILYSARLEAGRPTLGAGTFLLDVIGATVIGGTSLYGGKARIIWTFFGVLFFVLLSNTLNLMNLSAFQVDMVKGAVILAAALLDVLRQRISSEIG